MPRPKGSKVITCKNEECQMRVVGMPKTRVVCKHCSTRNYIPKTKK